eukprot:TRINITY_DN16372_c0_g1_i1.p1 TRINITY_DN16372_c0_g1~~TRINITY_DN16372_c0_g1_i1.p1  ORF type:complete len:210 (+),score=60.86 TRINITY_DN16372_c0_g1_i1:92-721(+)
MLRSLVGSEMCIRDSLTFPGPVTAAFVSAYRPQASLAPPPDAPSGVLSRVLSGDQLLSVTLPLWGCFFMANYAGYGNFMWMNEFLAQTGHKDLAKLEYMVFAAVEAVGVVLTTVVIDKAERRTLLAAAFLSGGACILGGVLLMEYSLYLALFLIAMNAFFEQAVWCVLYVYAGEVYPSTVRNSATGLAMGPTRIGGVLSTTLGLSLIHI